MSSYNIVTCSPGMVNTFSTYVYNQDEVVFTNLTILLFVDIFTGASVGQDYKHYREQAREYAVARNKLLEQATSSYLGYGTSLPGECIDTLCVGV